MKRVYRALRPIYGVHNRPTERTILHTIGKLEINLTLLDDTRPIRPRTARTVENIKAVNECFAVDPEKSIQRRSQQHGLSYGTTWAILRKDLGLNAYKIQIDQGLKPADLPKRHNFSRWALGKLAEDPHFGTRLLFSNEAHFWLNGYVNTRNCRIWGEEQPEAIQELPLHPLKTTVGCGL